MQQPCSNPLLSLLPRALRCRAANIQLRFAINIRLLASLFVNLAILLIWFAQIGSCAAYVETALGAVPVQVGGSFKLAATYVGSALSCNAW